MADDEFHCLRCGNCCRWPGYVRISESEIGAIARCLGISEEDFLAHWTVLTADRRGLSLPEDEHGICRFLEDGDPPRCRIESAKPRQCRDFPLRWNFPDWERECAGGAARTARKRPDATKQS